MITWMIILMASSCHPTRGRAVDLTRNAVPQFELGRRLLVDRWTNRVRAGTIGLGLRGKSHRGLRLRHDWLARVAGSSGGHRCYWPGCCLTPAIRYCETAGPGMSTSLDTESRH